MKKILIILSDTVIIMALLFGLSACDNGGTAQGSIDNGEENTVTGNSKILTVYFSRTGNTQQATRIIAEKTGAEIFRVLTIRQYPENYQECTEIAQQEQDEDARPELSVSISSETFATYDTIFIGYPIWWGTMPMAMFTFLDSYDFEGKTVIPFCTHGGSGLSRSVSDIRSLCPDSTVLDGLALRSGSVSQSNIESWLNGLGY